MMRATSGNFSSRIFKRNISGAVLKGSASLAILCSVAAVNTAQAQTVTRTYTSNDTPKVIGTPGIATSTIVGVQGGEIFDVNVSLDVNHTYVGDLDVSLSSPTTSDVDLFTNISTTTATGCVNIGAFGSSCDLNGVYVLDDDGGTTIQAAPDGGSGTLINGTYTSESGTALDTFDNENAAGNWALSIEANFFIDTGSLNSWSLIVAYLDGCNPAGSPAGETHNCWGTIAAPFNAGGGADTININAGTFASTINGGSGEDTININDGATTANVNGGGDADTIWLNSGADVNGTIQGGAGNDTINLQSGGEVDNVNGGSQDDVINLNGAVVTTVIQGGDGNDDIYLNSGSVPDVRGGTDSGNDEFFVNAGFDLTAVNIIRGGAGIDSLTLNGQSIEAGNLPTLTSIETTNLVNGTTLWSTMGAATLPSNLRVDATSSVNMQDGAADDMLTVAGDYSSIGTLAVDAELNAVGVSDILEIQGNVNVGPTAVAVQDVGDGTGSVDPIDVVMVAGNTADGDFALAGPVVAGPFEYSLALNDAGDTWQLVGDVLEEGSAYPVLANAILGDTRQIIGMFWDRETATRGRGIVPVADLESPALAPTGSAYTIWARGEGYTARTRGAIAGTDANIRAQVERDLGYFQGGANFTFADDAMGRSVFSIFGHVGNSQSDVKDIDGNYVGKYDVDSYGVAGAFSYVGTNGFYGDLVVLYSGHDIESQTPDSQRVKTDGNTIAFSGEAGWGFAMTEAVSLIPQVQLVYQDSDIDAFTNTRDVPITASYRKAESLEGRFGVRMHYEDTLTSMDKALRIHSRMDIVHEFKENPITTVNGIGLGYNQKGTAFQYGGGAWLVPVSGRGVKVGTQFDTQFPFKKNKGTRSYAASVMMGVNW